MSVVLLAGKENAEELKLIVKNSFATGPYRVICGIPSNVLLIDRDLTRFGV